MTRFKFRGKRVFDDKWIEGDLVHGIDGDVYIGSINVVADIESTDVDLHEVDASTVELIQNSNE